MARWKVTPRTHGNTMTTTFEGVNSDRGNFEGYKMEQDISGVLASAKRDRDLEAHFGKKKNGYRKAFTIPDIVAREIQRDYGIDVFDPLFMHDIDKKARLFAIIEQHYKYLKTTEGSIA